MRVEIFFVRDAGVVATVELKRRVTGARIFRIIVSKFGHREKPCPVILLVIDKGSEICFYRTIFSFGLAIGLWMEGGGEFPLNLQEITQ